jgi:hypothetical protein
MFEAPADRGSAELDWLSPVDSFRATWIAARWAGKSLRKRGLA